MAVELITERGLWDDFIHTCPDQTLFHRWDLLKSIEKHSGYKFRSYGIFKGDRLISVLPLFRRKAGVSVLTSTPPGSGISSISLLLGPQYYLLKQRQREGYLDKISEAIGEIARLESPNYFSISAPLGFSDIRHFKWSGYDIGLNYTYMLDLTRPLEDIWDKLDKDCKREIRSCEKYDLSIKTDGDIRIFYDILENRYREQGLRLPIFSAAYLRDILELFPDNFKTWYLYNGEDLVDMAIFYRQNDSVTYWEGGVTLNKAIHGLEYLLWESIKGAMSEGLKRFEIQGANTKRLCLFKSKFNPSLSYHFIISKKDLLGKISESAYKKIIKRRWS